MAVPSYGEVCPDYECFDDHFPCRKRECILEHVWSWLNLLHISTQPETPRLIKSITRVMEMA
ncbi:MAG: hypothetical protein QW756_07785 [Nitrososphaerota archaeon]